MALRIRPRPTVTPPGQEPWGADLGVPHALAAATVMARLAVGPTGLGADEVVRRRQRIGPNALPQASPPAVLLVFLRQFGNPLIYILLVAAAAAGWEQDWPDAGFILAVLLVNATIGTVQELQAAKSAAALAQLVAWQATVIRDGEVRDVPAAEVVPGDLMVLEAGSKVAADVRLAMTAYLEVDESVLTGESLPVRKDAGRTLPEDAILADRTTMAFAGTLVARGRGQGVVVATGLHTALGHMSQVGDAVTTEPPLLARMARFTRTLAVIIGVAALAIAAADLWRGTPWRQVLTMAVALAVSAIPEGLPVALTVALAVATRRMAARRVIVRQLVSVEALGSCTIIASDKTGTLTVNRLTATLLVLPGEPDWTVTGAADRPEGHVEGPAGPLSRDQRQRLERLATAVVLANEGSLSLAPDGIWHGRGDAADVALLVMAHKMGISRVVAQTGHRHLAAIPFDPEHRCAASLERVGGEAVAYVKGAPEQVLAMCESQRRPEGPAPLEADAMMARVAALAARGYRLLAVAAGTVDGPAGEAFDVCHLRGLTLLGVVGMVDPLRPEARQSVAASRAAGVDVAMVTGDHPVTALAIARELGLARDPSDLVTGPQIRQAQADGPAALRALVRGRHVFARVEPRQKLAIVQALQQNGHFVAVTGDGANDVPALRAAQVSIAMGKGGTDIAREAADLILTDDDFTSIVAGIEEGRIAYNNVRKVVFLLVSTGAGELALFLLAVASQTPLPLLPAQLLWLNLVTNGVQDVALALEPGEGDELHLAPRSPAERIFDPLMVWRVGLSGVVIGGVAFAVYRWELATGMALAEARSSTLFLMVLFENALVICSRTERRSVFRQSLLTNPWLLIAVVVALAVHVGATLWPPTQRLLGVSPLPLREVGLDPLLALGLVLVVEGFMLGWRRWQQRHRGPTP